MVESTVSRAMGSIFSINEVRKEAPRSKSEDPDEFLGKI